MAFSSVTFLFYFLPVVVVAYFLAPSIQAKNLVALGFSIIFYAWGEPLFVIVLLLSIALNMHAAHWIDGSPEPLRRRALMWSVGGNLLLLFVFKYTVFAATVLADIASLLRLYVPVPRISLPLGISFFTFHSLSYIIDVYRRRFPALRDPTTVGLYLLLFPQLVAGPIVRYTTIARQLQHRRHTLGRASAGARIFLIGLAQKVLIADQVSSLANIAFDRTPLPGLSSAWSGLVAYTIQIYFDFAGYSNMAVGLGLIFGFTLPRNFRLPYTALSMTEFWRRWHMSLSSWLRDYLYIPLGGSRGTQVQTYRNLVTVFVLCGLWHGASWNFVLWGVWHGAFLLIERAGFSGVLSRWPGRMRWLYTMLAIMGGWVLFRAGDLATSGAFYLGLIGLNGFGTLDFEFQAVLRPIVLCALTVGCWLVLVPQTVWLRKKLTYLGPVLDPLFTFSLLLLTMIWIGAGTYSPFLYFRF